MDLIIVGLGRAGGSLARAAVDAGHSMVGILTSQPDPPAPRLDWDEPLPACDLGLICVGDDAIDEVAQRLAPTWGTAPVAHLSGFKPVGALQPLATAGAPTGSLHPLQTLPDAERGARALAGCWAAVTASEPDMGDLLGRFASSLGMNPFPLPDDAKALYHAASASASNYVVEALAVASDLLAAAGVDPAVVEPLTRQVVDNVFDAGAAAALTGPLARGDLDTVAGQLRAAHEAGADLGDQFRHLTEATAIRVGRSL